MSTRDILKNCFLCRELNSEELDTIAEIVVIRTIVKGEILFLQGDMASGFYTLITGQVRVYKASPDGKEYTLHLIHPGQMFAEAAIFGSEIFPANCIALEDSVVAFFPKIEFVNLISKTPQISLKMISALSRFVREFNQQIEDLSLKEISARLASYLCKEAKNSGGNTVSLDISKSELAHLLGTVSETLSRNFRKMKDLGIIEIDGKNIVIIDADKLNLISKSEKI